MSTVSSPTETFHSALTTSSSNNKTSVVQDELIDKVLLVTVSLSPPKAPSKSKRTIRGSVQASKIIATAPNSPKSLPMSPIQIQKLPTPQKPEWNLQLAEQQPVIPFTPVKKNLIKGSLEPALNTTNPQNTEPTTAKKNLFTKRQPKKIKTETEQIHTEPKFKKTRQFLKKRRIFL